VTAITPDLGSTAGGAFGAISGTDFEPGAVVTFGTTVVRNVSVQDSTTLLFWTSEPHAAGTVDVAVTNPGGLTDRLLGGFTYVLPESFDVNGDWLAHAGPDFETDMRISIRDGALVSFECGASTAVTPTAPVPITGGQFTFRREDGATISGTVVSPVNLVGSVHTITCPDARWWAEKK
jgi:hypothetical protein